MNDDPEMDKKVKEGLRAISRSLEDDVLSPEACAEFNRIMELGLARPTVETKILPAWVEKMNIKADVPAKSPFGDDMYSNIDEDLIELSVHVGDCEIWLGIQRECKKCPTSLALSQLLDCEVTTQFNSIDLTDGVKGFFRYMHPPVVYTWVDNFDGIESYNRGEIKPLDFKIMVPKRFVKAEPEKWEPKWIEMGRPKLPSSEKPLLKKAIDAVKSALDWSI